MAAQPPDQRPITVVPATPERWPDIEEFFTGHACWCQYWRVSAAEYGRVSTGELEGSRRDERRDALRYAE